MNGKICVLLTGGTICSVPDANGKNYSDAQSVKTVLTDYFLRESGSPFQGVVAFDVFSLSPDVLSENITVGALGDILGLFQEKVNPEGYAGVILLHGTDTLAYTAAFLSLALAGYPIPVMLVSAQLRLGERNAQGEWVKNEQTNGYANFRAAVELIMNGIAPNVYAVYRNVEGVENGKPVPAEFLVHYGVQLKQCPSHSERFHSAGEMEISDPENARLPGKPFESNARLYQKINGIKGGVLLLSPYTAMNYKAISLKGVKAIVHGTYHSQTVCIGKARAERQGKGQSCSLKDIEKKDRPYSILYLLNRCNRRKIPVFLAPCNRASARYGTTQNACEQGAVPVGSSEITVEAAYAKALLGVALGKRAEELTDFMLATRINHEF